MYVTSVGLTVLTKKTQANTGNSLFCQFAQQCRHFIFKFSVGKLSNSNTFPGLSNEPCIIHFVKEKNVRP